MGILYLKEIATAYSAQDGGAIAAGGSTISIYGSVSFHSNYAHHGGAMFLDNITLEFCGNISLIKNNAKVDGGALHISCDTTISFNGNHTRSVTSHSSATQTTMVLFQQNTATDVGGAISESTWFTNNILIFTGNVSFVANSAHNGLVEQ